MAENDFVTALSRGLTVLQAFSENLSEGTLTEIASAVGLNAAATRRSLLTLEELGYVTRSGKRFLLTPRVLRFSDAFLSSMGVLEVVQQFLQEITDETGDTTSLGVLDQTDVLYIATVPVKRAFHTTPTTGTRYPLFCSSMGRVLLAHSDESVTTAAIQPEILHPFTTNTVTDPAQLRTLFQDAHDNGYAAIQEEVAYGVASLAVPVRDPAGNVIAAVNCSTATDRATASDLIESRLDALRRGSARIQNGLRRHPTLVHSIIGSRITLSAEPDTVVHH